MPKFRISFLSTNPDIEFGSKIFIEDIEARYIRETSTGYALIDDRDAIVYTVPAGLVVEEVKEG